MAPVRIASLVICGVLLLAATVQAASLAAVRQRGALEVCAHPDALPFSSQDRTQPGFQLEIAEAIAKELGLGLRVDWIVFTRHARRMECDAIMGSIIFGDQAGKPRPGQRLTKPYSGSGYLLVVRQTVSDIHRPEDVQGGKVAVEHTSWPHYLLNQRGVATSSYRSSLDILDAVAQGEVVAGFVTDAYLGWHLKLQPHSPVKVADGYVREPDLRWNIAIGLRNADTALVEAINQALDRLLANQTIQNILAKYGVPYVPPFTR